MANQYTSMNSSWASDTTDWNSARGNGSAMPPEGGVYLDEREEEKLLEEDYAEEQDDDEADYYSTLNVSPTATSAQIKAAYHALSKRFHPDKQSPEMRESATRQFNKIIQAYEVLINPRQRMIYDQFGAEGVKERTLQVGARTKTPAQFKLWLEEQMRQKKEEDLAELVVSTGKVAAAFDISGLWFTQLVVSTDPKTGRVTKTFQPYPIGRMSQYQVNHTFQIPLPELGELLEKPLPRKPSDLWTTSPEKKKPTSATSSEDPRPRPTLSLSAQIGGVPNKPNQNLPSTIVANTNLGVGLNHSFPSLPPDAPVSLASLMAGNAVSIEAGILPQPMVNTVLSRNFGQNTLTTRATFIALPRLDRAPITEVSLSRRLNLRNSVFIGINTGSVTWLTGLNEVFSLAKPGQVRNGFFSIGWIYHPVSAVFADAEESASGNGEKARTPKTSRSKRTETYQVSITGGLMARGIQAKFAWGRTFFLGSTLASPSKTLETKPGNVGIRLGVEGTLHITGAAQYTVKATRRVFNNTTLGISVSSGGATGGKGVTIGMTWSRLGQRINIPIIIAPVPDNKLFLYATGIPFVSYIAAEIFWLRPRDRKIRREEQERVRMIHKAKTARRKKLAEEAQNVMRVSVEARRNKERKEGGLVVVEATWGVEVQENRLLGNATGLLGGEKKKKDLVTDVTIPVQALVENGQLVIQSGIDKSRIIGFYDPAPGMEKVLKVKYLFQGREHEAVVRGKRGLTAPKRQDLI
ncbi:hypothetical protein BZA77DRAFT_387282 [Pyronema omphalodes]|nr:hypothetical protein BZA77DRAFT_387282 [Pyronema omphalodes]